MIALGVGIFVALLYLLMFGLCRAAAEGDRKLMEWHQRESSGQSDRS